MKKSNRIIINIIITLLILLFAGFCFQILGKTAKYDEKLTSHRPRISDSPIYVETKMGEETRVLIQPKRDIKLGGFEILLVNINKESKGNIEIELSSSEGILCQSSMEAALIESGSWTYMEASCELFEGQDYYLSILAEGCEPYFMSVPGNGFLDTPVSPDKNISVAFVEREDRIVSYGDIFYYSYVLLFLLALVFVCIVWMGQKVFLDNAKRFLTGIYRGYDFCRNDLFLLLVFVFLSVNIYVKAVQNGVFISADSSGYLREAVNMAAGNGMSYDGLAGYDSWFANWPILYPFMICIVMLVTGLDAYLSSKILSLILIGVILIVFRIAFKKDAWLYSLCLLNPGFIEISQYTWSELPFMLFMLWFGISLGKIVSSDEVKKRDYFFLGLAAFLTFLTRYFGIYLYFAGGVYILVFLYEGLRFQKNRSVKDLINGYKCNQSLKKAVGLTLTEGLSSGLCLLYMLLNKLMNGMPSGVSRTDWWDDYENLTNDLVGSLFTEFFNVFHLETPAIFSEFSYAKKALLLILILVGLIIFVIKNYNRRASCNVFILMAVVYNGMFIVIRYFSSMDTFYFRFFEPSTFLLCIGIIGLLLLKHDSFRGQWWTDMLGVSLILILLLSLFSLKDNGYLDDKSSYYELTRNTWDEAYEDIPQKSVVIFSDLDYRSEYYRPDVVSGQLYTDDNLQSLRERYYGSSFFCIQSEYAKVMIDSGEYTDEINELLLMALSDNAEENKYLAIKLNGE